MPPVGSATDWTRLPEGVHSSKKPATATAVVGSGVRPSPRRRVTTFAGVKGSATRRAGMQNAVAVAELLAVVLGEAVTLAVTVPVPLALDVLVGVPVGAAPLDTVAEAEDELDTVGGGVTDEEGVGAWGANARPTQRVLAQGAARKLKASAPTTAGSYATRPAAVDKNRRTAPLAAATSPVMPRTAYVVTVAPVPSMKVRPTSG